ncbi:hypothetical protein OS493_035119 [Desmophyllum pertusum]|uniref:Uncharacterized protein n=1 Tax=Desmophyllum pertusum TaxID=174260 RepID=A0A9W9YV21_9CNID|nr:hypothetical protein OS493_035119 [Desmophyllum pertusum]
MSQSVESELRRKCMLFSERSTIRRYGYSHQKAMYSLKKFLNINIRRHCLTGCFSNHISFNCSRCEDGEERCEDTEMLLLRSTIPHSSRHKFSYLGQSGTANVTSV